MANGPNRLSLLEERPHEADSVLVHPELVGVRNPAGQNEAVVIGGISLRDNFVYRERVGLVQVVERLDLASLGRQELELGPGPFERLPGLGQLDLLDAFRGGQKRDSLAL